jgi:hypothetical protein
VHCVDTPPLATSAHCMPWWLCDHGRIASNARALAVDQARSSGQGCAFTARLGSCSGR